MGLKNVKYVDASSLAEAEQKKLGIDEGLVAIETYNDEIHYKPRSLKSIGIVAYLLEGEPNQ